MPEQPNILLLYGSDELAIQAHVKKLCQELGDAVTAEMNISQFTGQQGNFDEINTAVNSAPFLAPRRVVVLESACAASLSRAFSILYDFLDRLHRENYL